MNDLELIDTKQVEKHLRTMEETVEKRIKTREELLKNNDVREKTIIHTGRILHIDGDAHLSNKKKYSNTNTSEQVIFNHNKNNVSKIKIHYFFITKREEFCEREHI